MCQLLGLNAALPVDATFSFTGFAPRGGRTDNHIDGFGLGFFERGQCQVFKDEHPAADSPLAEMLQHRPFPSTHTIAHLRRATQGVVSLANCHPFQRQLWNRSWLFAHNGDLKRFAPELNGPFQPDGATDSERAFCALMQTLLDHFGPHEPSQDDWLSALVEAIGTIAAHGPFNLLLSNGEVMLAHCSTNLHHVTRSFPFARAHLADAEVAIDFARHTGPNDRVTVIATHPLTRDETWTPCTPGELLVLRDGAVQERWTTAAFTARAIEAQQGLPPWAEAA